MFFGQKSEGQPADFQLRGWAMGLPVFKSLSSQSSHPNKIIMTKKKQTIDFEGLVILTFFFPVHFPLVSPAPVVTT
jgi:hypothetical protein